MASESDGQGKLSASSTPSSNRTDDSKQGIAEEDPKEQDEGDEEEDEDEDEDDEDDEPRLKYASLTKGQGSIYRNGDAASTFLVAGDKMVIGTHNGFIHVLSLPSFQSLRAYHAHTASVSTIAISPFPPPLPSSKSDAVGRVASEQQEPSLRSSSKQAPGPRKQMQVPNTPSNSIHVATSSIDGNVCVFSLIDPKDVLLRNFGRPVQAVALSPDYKNDRSYLSGGLAGSLVLTVGGKAGASANANTSGASAAAAGWLNTIGLGGNNGIDTVLHSGEGNISTIKWSLSGRYVVWVNEKGIKIMRSHLRLESGESEFAWKRMGHIDRPSRAPWDEMAGVWKARIDWIDEDGLERDDEVIANNAPRRPSENPDTESARSVRSVRTERLVVGWGDFIWIIDVHPGGTGVGKEVGERKIGRIDIVTKLRTDCIISGVSLYTPKLLVVLAYVTPDEAQDTTAPNGTPKKGIHRRQNALQPEMRIIDIGTKEEVCVADTLTVSRFESLSATDYHLGVLPVMRTSAKVANHRGALEVIGGIGGSIWDATMYPTRLFSSTASVRSAGSAGEKKAGSQAASSDTGSVPFLAGQGPHPALLTRGMKIFIQSPYDCVLATKPTQSDHLVWLDEHGRYEDAWKLLDLHPDSVVNLSDEVPESDISTPTNRDGHSQLPNAQTSLVEFFADDASQTTASGGRNYNSQAEKEKRRIGRKWLEQLIKNDEWSKSGQVCSQVLSDAASWEHWVWVFAEANKFAEITPFIPTTPLKPPINSTVYEVVLGHYISRDRLKLGDLLERWSPELFDAGSIVSAIESRLKVGDIKETSVEDGETGRDWRILTDGLAKLYLADGRASDALKCYIKLQDADAAMSLIASHHLIDAVADDISGLILLRVSKEQQKDGSLSELEESSIEPIRLLVSEAYHGIVHTQTVIKQLEKRKGMKPFLYLYIRALWNGDTIEAAEKPKERRSRRDMASVQLASEGKSLVNDSADTALYLFAEYDRELLFEFLKTSQSYTLSTATAVCEKRDFIPELVYLLAKEGQTKRALHIIIDKLGDVSQAISFAKEQDDPDLWNDLLKYSMTKPVFIRALLEEVGTAINPITLVRRIPEGLEIIGLRDALTRMIKEYELQDSISEGVARVLRGEVAAGMLELRCGQKRGMSFAVVSEEGSVPGNKSRGNSRGPRRRIPKGDVKKGHCSSCGEILAEGELDPLISFPCTHAFHLSCFLTYESSPPSSPNPASPSSNATDKDPAHLTTFPSLDDPMAGTALEDFDGGIDQGIGPKIQFAKDLRIQGKVRPGIGCPLEAHQHHNEVV